ncbi:MAG: hypothetical protein HW416_81 [Chloroflexi bacterium]|nr:hypothetical protein [Chloroflexota bacterium]
MLLDGYVRSIKKTFAKTPYGEWLRDEGVATVEGFGVDDVWRVDLAPWPRLGGKALFINLYPFMEGLREVYVAEIAPGGSTEPLKHLFEKFVMILEGHGATEIWQEGDTTKHVFEWGRGSIFSPPLNTWHRLYNHGSEPVRFLATSDAPRMINGFHNLDFIFNCPYTFRDRYDGRQSYFVPTKHSVTDGRHWVTNFVPSVFEEDLDEGDERHGSGVLGAMFEMSGNNWAGRIAQWPVGRYRMGHYHHAGALLLGLRSEGYVLLWPKELGSRPYEIGRGDEVVQVPWGRGSVYTPPSDWYHQHFNTGPEPARHLAFHGGGGPDFDPLSLRMASDAQEGHFSMVDMNEGGTLISYSDEDPEIRKRYQEALRAKGVEFTMPESTYLKGAAPRSRWA